MEIHSLKIGTTLSVTTTSLKQYIGQYNGYMTVPASIFLRNARSYEAENCETDLIYKDLMLEYEDILKIDVVNDKDNKEEKDEKEKKEKREKKENKFEPFKEVQEVQATKALTEFKCINKSVTNPSTLKWIPGNQWKNFNQNDSRQKPNLKINQYCKELFKSCSFIKLISPEPKMENGGNLEIGLPSYRAIFYRQPKIELKPVEGEIQRQLHCYGDGNENQEIEILGVICKEIDCDEKSFEVEGQVTNAIVNDDLSFLDGIENLFKEIPLSNEASVEDIHSELDKLSTHLIQTTLSSCKLQTTSAAVELNSPFLKVGNFTIYPGKLYLKSYEQIPTNVNQTNLQHVESAVLNKMEVDS